MRSSRTSIADQVEPYQISLTLSYTDPDEGTVTVTDSVTIPGTLPDKTENPDPPDMASDLGVHLTLSWDEAFRATSYDIYFGTAPDCSEFFGNQIGTSIETGTLESATIYYWRVDSVNEAGARPGDCWTFSTLTLPDKTENPSPPDMEQNVDLHPTLSWDVAPGATSYNIYFGTTPDCNEILANQVGTSIEIGPLEYESTYHWRVDSVNGAGATPGDCWTFSTTCVPLYSDLNGDCILDIYDLTTLTAVVWGPCVDCPEDLNNDGFVDILDFLLLLFHWGDLADDVPPAQ